MNAGTERDSVIEDDEYVECPLCLGDGCEEGCGAGGGCEMKYAGPYSHRVCHRCLGSGLVENGSPVVSPDA